MRDRSTRIAVAIASTFSILALGEARADTLDEACQVLDLDGGMSCTIARTTGDQWVLRTGYTIGAGLESTVEVFETRFCDAVREAGVQGRVMRSGELPGIQGSGAVMTWTCGLPAVASGPRPR